jgi:hypothetical protein
MFRAILDVICDTSLVGLIIIYGYILYGIMLSFKIGGYSESGNPVSWKLFSIDNMSNISILDEEFSGLRPEYNPKD